MTNKRVYTTKKGTNNMTSRAIKNSVKHRKPVNRYSMKREAENVSTSAKKWQKMNTTLMLMKILAIDLLISQVFFLQFPS